MEQFASLASGWAGFDLQTEAPWLAMLLMLVCGIGLPAAAYGLFDRWVANRLRIDTIALATRYGGFMNSWAVFGRHASEYRDLRPIFPAALAAEFARFHDGTATIAARFADARVAADTAAATFGSFAAAGIEHSDAGLSFRTGQTARGYACGQWLLIGDTLFIFYGADAQALANRRQATPALRARRFPGPLRLLHSRGGHGLLMVFWVLLNMAATSWLLEAAGRQVPVSGAPAGLSELRLRLANMTVGGLKLQLLPVAGKERVLILLPPTGLRNPDLDRLAGRSWISGVELQFDDRRSVVNILPLIGQAAEAGDGSGHVLLPERWRSNLLLEEPDDALEGALRTAVLAAGWIWQPRLWPWPLLWRDPWHPVRG